jgi:hypothetical protein
MLTRLVHVVKACEIRPLIYVFCNLGGWSSTPKFFEKKKDDVSSDVVAAKLGLKFFLPKNMFFNIF